MNITEENARTLAEIEEEHDWQPGVNGSKQCGQCQMPWPCDTLYWARDAMQLRDIIAAQERALTAADLVVTLTNQYLNEGGEYRPILRAINAYRKTREVENA